MISPVPAFVSMVSLALALGACSKPENHAAQPAQEGQVEAAQKVTANAGVTPITVNDDGFSPNHVEVKHGQQTTLRFTRTSEKTCATEVAFPELKITKPLPLNQPVDIEIPSDQARTLTFTCGMGMYKSKVVVL
ncbi:MAG: cupredoxin domain-containing protein [Myxococcales bacterium]